MGNKSYKYVVHPGTGLVMEVDDDLFVVETDMDVDDLECFMADAIRENGVPLETIVDYYESVVKESW